MIQRRDLLFGVAAVAAAGCAQGLRPSRRVSLMARDSKMEALVPVSFPGWSAAASEGMVKPKVEGLAATLYDEVVQRTYVAEQAAMEVMLLIAYGGTQSDLLQLHRPEVCYPAIGFTIASKSEAPLPLPGGGVLPTVRIVAVAGDRRENIIYWTRLGEALPTNGSQQRSVLLKDAMQGFIPDGVLVRASMVSDDSEAAFGILDRFVPSLLSAVPPANRPALVGSQITRQFAQTKV